MTKKQMLIPKEDVKINDDGSVIVILGGGNGKPQDYPTGLPCNPPNIQGDECADGYKPVCKNNKIWCEWEGDQ